MQFGCHIICAYVKKDKSELLYCLHCRIWLHLCPSISGEVRAGKVFGASSYRRVEPLPSLSGCSFWSLSGNSCKNMSHLVHFNPRKCIPLCLTRFCGLKPFLTTWIIQWKAIININRLSAMVVKIWVNYRSGDFSKAPWSPRSAIFYLF